MADWTEFFAAELGAVAALSWMVRGIVFALIATILNAWVLLVEILH